MVMPEPSVQVVLPQVILGNERRVTKAFMHEMIGTTPANVHLWRQKSSWNSHATMRRVLSTLARSLGALLRDRYVSLILDVASQHIHGSIAGLAKRLGIRFVYVPAKLTYLLQPCDTHVF